MEVRVRRSIGLGRGGAYIKEVKTDAGVRSIPVTERLRTAVRPSEGYVLGGETFYNPTRLGKQWSSFAAAFGVIGSDGRVEPVRKLVLSQPGPAPQLHDCGADSHTPSFPTPIVANFLCRRNKFYLQPLQLSFTILYIDGVWVDCDSYPEAEDCVMEYLRLMKEV